MLGFAMWLFFVGFLWVQGTAELEPLARLAVPSFFVILIGTLLPDADTPKSQIGRVLEISVAFGALAFGFTTFFRGLETLQQDAVYAIITAVAIFVLFILVRPRHRGVTHSFKMALAYGVAVFVWAFLSMGLNTGMYFGVLALGSVVSHLVLDG